jgi:hypothetical protein
MMKSNLIYIKHQIERTCEKKSFACTPEFETFLYGFLKERFKCSDDEFVEMISQKCRLKPIEIDMAIEDAIVRFKQKVKR